jgi:ankyrin repeat protein
MRILILAVIAMMGAASMLSIGEAQGQETESTLRAAIDANDISAVTRALAAGANPNELDQYALTPLVRAVVAGNEAIVVDLLRNGADPNEARVARSPLEVAFEAVVDRRVTCNVSMVKVLLTHGANPNGVFPALGELPLQRALELGAISCVNALIDHGADPHARSARGKTALEAAIQGSSEIRTLELVNRVFALGADVNGETGRRGGPLVEATAQHNVVVVRLLLKMGADPCLAEPHRGTAWDVARTLGYQDIVALMASYQCKS